MKTFHKKGLSIAEILVALGIMALVVSIFLSTFISFRKNQALDKDTEAIVEVLVEARRQTLDSKNSSNYGVHLSAAQITSFTGGVYNSGDSSNINYPLNSTDTILTISLVGGGSDVVFNRLTGETSESGTVVVSSPGISRTKTVTIYKTGVIESQ